MLDYLLSTKLNVPPARLALVPRPSLVARLDDGLHRKLSLLSAPAGFGKTTLALEWLNGLAQRTQENVQVAWLSLDENDNDANRFFTYFVTALSQAGSGDAPIGNAALEILNTTQQPAAEKLLTALINDIAGIETKILFVLDDYHLIEIPAIHTAVNFFIENLPPQLHFVLLTRADPPSPLARLRSRRQLTEIRSADLRFSQSEAAQFLNDVMGLHLDETAVTKLEKRTEGWIAGLQMAALSMRDRKDVDGFIETFSGTNRFILDYLLEEVLDNQPPEIQRFLLSSSILKRLSAPLCDALLESPGQSAATLEYLDRVNLFLLPLDDERCWYRFHHLFADLLQARLKQAYSPESLRQLHTRAANWHEANDMVYAAIYHASKLEDETWVESLIEKNYMKIFQQSDSAFIRHWTGELSDEAIFTSVRLSIHEAMSRSWLGQLQDAKLMLNEAERQLQRKPDSPETRALFGHLSYVRGRITAMGGDFPQAIQLCLTARENTPPSNQGLLGGIGVMLGYGYFLNGDFSPAAQTLEETIVSGKKTGALNTTVGSYCVLARLRKLQGELDAAFELYRDAAKAIAEIGGEHRGTASIVDVGQAEIFYQRGQLEAAFNSIQHGMENIAAWGKPDDIVLGLVTFAKIQSARGDHAGAGSSIEKADEIIQTSGVFPEARDAVLAAQIRLSLSQNDPAALVRFAGLLEKRLEDEHSFHHFENEPLFLMLVRLYIRQGREAQALALCSQMEARAQAGGRAERHLEIRMLQALALHQSGQLAQAVPIFTGCLKLAESQGYLRIFLDEGQPMKALLSIWLSQAKADELVDFAKHVLSQFDNHADVETLSQGSLIEPLSPREIEVLDLIAQGKTNKEIAAELIVSPGTVKAHTSSIYRKLDVANRTEAVARARELEILS